MDNNVFNVNGRTEEQLLKTLELIFLQTGRRAEAWKQDKEYGLILFWVNDATDSERFPTPLDAKGVLPLVMSWLNGDFAKTVDCKGWDADTDHDGHNTMGWRVFCEDWGHVNGDWRAFCAIKPAYMWHGK